MLYVAWGQGLTRRLQSFNVIILCYCKPTKGILPADKEALEAVMPLKQSSITLNDQDDTSESSQSDQPPLLPKTYQDVV